MSVVSLNAKLTLMILWPLFALYRLFYKGRHPRDFEENPLNMNPADVAYLGFKYYYESPLPSKEAINYFEKNKWVQQPIKANEIIAKLTLHFGGDLMPYKDINPAQCANLWEKSGTIFFDADIVFANLETPLHPDKKPVYVPEMMLNDMLFNSSKEQFEIFNGNKKFRGIDLVSFSNNHTLDQGIEGISATRAYLASQNILTVGIKTKEEENEIVILERNGIKTAWLAFTYCTNKQRLPKDSGIDIGSLPLNSEQFSPEKIKEKAEKAKALGAEFIIASLHMGNAYQAMPEKTIQRNIQKIIDTELIDIIIGTHPHLPQPLAACCSPSGKKVPVVYSLGDFIAWDIYTFSHLTQILQLEIVKTASGVEISDLKIKPLFMYRNKKHQLQLIPLEELVTNKEPLIKDAYFPEEIEKNIRYYEEYLAPYNP